jgi:uncharacterized protein (TIGR03437 family)
MRSQRVIVTILLTAFFCMPVYLISNEDGPLPRHTGGPFPGEQTCAITDCHIGTPVNSAGGSVSIMIDGLPASRYAYVPGQTVPVVVRVEDPAQVRWGFELTARGAGGCAQAGSFSTSANENPGAVQIYPTNSMDNIPECPPDPLQFPMHMVPKAGPGGASYTFNWTAPSSAGFGPVTFAAAGNAANGDRDPGGDHIYTTSAVVPPAAVEPAPKPSISSGGVVVATGTPVVENISANAILTIFGQNFAPAGTAVFNPAVDIEGHIDTRLADTCVEINNVRSPMFVVLPTQINLQAPTINAAGPVAVVVIRACGTPQENRSDPEMVNMASVSPSFFNFVNSQNGENPIAALHGGGPALVGPAGLLGDAAETTPAAPGEFVSLFATGLGPTDPPFIAGEIPQSAANPLGAATGEVSLTIGGIAVVGDDLFYVGVAPCCAGLYQVVAKVPDAAPDGNLPVVVTVDSIASPEGPFLAVARP